MSLLQKPSAWIPLVLTLGIMGMFLFYIVVAGPPEPQADEGIAAHLFQLWLVVEAVLVTLFAVKWLPREPKQALIILTLQILGVAAACFPVFYFQL